MTLVQKNWGMFYKIYKSKSPQCLLELIPGKTHAYATRNIPFFNIRHKLFTYPFFPSTIIQWGQLRSHPPRLKNFSKNSILKFTRHVSSNFFDCDNHKVLVLSHDCM